MDVFRLINSSDVEGVKVWIESKTTDKNVVSYDGETPLMRALWRDEKDIAKLFVKNELYIFNENENGNTPLHRAVNAFTEITLLLIGKGAKVYAANKYGQLPIHFAALGGNFKDTRILIEKGSEINTTDMWGKSSLSYSIGHLNTFEASKILLDEGAALFNNINYLRIVHDNNKTLVKYHFKLQAFILVCRENNSSSRSAILRFSNTFKLSFK